MHLNKDYESEINLKNLFFFVLYRWRSILAVALVGAALLGGYKYISLRNVLHSESSAREEELYEQRVNERREMVQRKEKHYNDLDIYRNESVYFQLNPLAIWTASCKYLVNADPVIQEQLQQGAFDPVDRILAAYTMPFADVTDDELLDNFNVAKSEYVHELVEIITNPTENSLTVSFKGPTKEYAQKGLEYFKGIIETMKTKAQAIGAHTLMVIGEETVITADKDLLENQVTLNSVLSLDGSLLSTARIRLNEAEVEGKPQNACNQLVKFVVIGFAAGAFLMILLYVFTYVFRGRMTESRELSEQFNLPLLGEFVRSGSIHNNKGLDKLFARWELGKKAVDDEITYNTISVLMNEKEAVNSILLISSLSTGKLKGVKESLTARVPNKEIKAMGNFLKNSEAIEQATKADAVILAEEKNQTRRKDIPKMAEVLSAGNANVSGVIVL